MAVFALSKLKTWIHRKRRGNKTFWLPPRPKRTSARKFALRLLQAGAEIEHSLLVQYLYAAYSVDERANNDPQNIGLQWKTHIRLIAREEMAHLATVQNLLLSLKGGEIYLNRGPINKNVKNLPLPFQLEPLSEKSLGKYVLFESPLESVMKSVLDEETFTLVKDIRRRLGPESRVVSVGSLYAALYWLFLESDDPGDDWPFPQGSDREFIGRYKKGFHLRDDDFADRASYRQRAARPEEWGVYEDETHVDGASPRDTALGSLRWIMAQGEGPNVIEESHFFRFVEMYRRFQELGADSPVLQVPTNPRIGAARPGARIRNEISRLWAKLGNSRYQLLILDIFESLNAKRTTERSKRGLLAKWAIVEMEFVKKIGQMLPRMFLARSAAKGAGAVFEQVVLPRSDRECVIRRQSLLENSDAWIAQVTKLRNLKLHPPKPTKRAPKKRRSKVPEHTEDTTTEAMEESLLDAVARQNDEMREILRQREGS